MRGPNGFGGTVECPRALSCGARGLGASQLMQERKPTSNKNQTAADASKQQKTGSNENQRVMMVMMVNRANKR